MVAAMADKPRPVGRPRKFKAGAVKYMFLMPEDLHGAVEKHRVDRGLSDRADALRELLREVAESRKLFRHADAGSKTRP
jgi:hypothetical protein